MESEVNFISPQNISGASQQNSVTTFSLTTGLGGDLLSDVIKQCCAVEPMQPLVMLLASQRSEDYSPV